MREGKKASKEVVNTNGRNIDTVLGNCLKCRVGGFSCMPVKLHVDSAWPLNDCITPDRIRERRNEDIGPRRLCGNDGAIEIGDKIAGPFRAEGIRNGSLESKQRNRAYRSLQKLGACPARSRRDSDHHLLCTRASKRTEEGFHESINIFRRDIDVRCIVLWTDGNGRSGVRALRGRGPSQARAICEAENEQTRCENTTDAIHVVNSS